MTAYHPFLLADFYKISHRAMYPERTEFVYSTWTARGSRVEGVDEVVAFGFQAFVQRWLIEYFNEHFFARPQGEVLDEYRRVISATLGVENPDTTHLADLHALGYLPLEIRAVAEGTRVPTRVPMLTIENTDPRFFWLTNALETLMSAELWQPTTSATIAARYREILDGYAEKTTGSTEGVQFQGHDFSMRGMEGMDAAAASGAGHLLSFVGTDTIPAILFHERYYGANVETELVGTSIPATEHSVMCAYGQDEIGAFRRLITEVHPGGFISIVSDTWDLWQVIGEVLPTLRDEVLERDGRVVIRPDSGDPVLIMTGDPQAEGLARVGVVEALWDIFGGTVNELGYKVLDSHIGAIYGDSITMARAEEISRRLMDKGFASTNAVYGIGSYTYQYQTRDTFEMALKATWVQIDGVEQAIFKDPATDVRKVKRSAKGRVAVLAGETGLYLVDELDRADWTALAERDQLTPLFRDGELLRRTTLAEIRERVAEG